MIKNFNYDHSEILNQHFLIKSDRLDKYENLFNKPTKKNYQKIVTINNVFA